MSFFLNKRVPVSFREPILLSQSSAQGLWEQRIYLYGVPPDNLDVVKGGPQIFVQFPGKTAQRHDLVDDRIPEVPEDYPFPDVEQF